MKRLTFLFALSIISVAFLSLFGHAVKKYANGQQQKKQWRALNEFVSFPRQAKAVVKKELLGIPPVFKANAIKDTFNRLDKNIFGLAATWDIHRAGWDVELSNLRNDSTIHRWYLSEINFTRTDRFWSNSEPRNPILLPNRNLITNNDESKNLYRLDSASNIIWHNDELHFHHSLNLDADTNIWVCTMQLQSFVANDDVRKYRDNFLTKVDSESGEVLFHKSVSELLIENNLMNFVFGLRNEVFDYGADPLHLNDIQPVLANGRYWKKGDVFFSLRHRDAIILYRPETNKIIRLIFGEFLAQHDPEILNDSMISVFNNFTVDIGDAASSEDKSLKKFNHSRITTYNFSDSSFNHILMKHFSDHKIYTNVQGFHQKLSGDLWYVEDWKNGIMYIMNEYEVIYKKQLRNRLENRNLVENLHWIRLYENIDF